MFVFNRHSLSKIMTPTCHHRATDSASASPSPLVTIVYISAMLREEQFQKRTKGDPAVLPLRAVPSRFAESHISCPHPWALVALAWCSHLRESKNLRVGPKGSPRVWLALCGSVRLNNVVGVVHGVSHVGHAVPGLPLGWVFYQGSCE